MSSEETTDDGMTEETGPPAEAEPRTEPTWFAQEGEQDVSEADADANADAKAKSKETSLIATKDLDRIGTELLRSLQIQTSKWFCDEHGVPYGCVPCTEPGPHRRVLPVKSEEMDQYISSRCLEKAKFFPDRSSRNTFREVMLALAWRGGVRPMGNRFVRTAENGRDVIWIDMADDLWRAIRVTAEGWEIVNDPPPLFRRHKHQLPLAEPARGGDPRELFSFLPPMAEPDRLLCLAWLATIPVESIARPILLPVGPQGSAKTSMCRRFRTVLDPSRVPLLGDDGRRDLLLTVNNHALPAFDNLGRISGPESDLLCRVVTGGGTERRKLYTDSGEFILSFRRPILMNGINLPSDRPDLLDRSIVIRVSRIENPRPEETLDAEYAAALPRLLGSVLDLLVGAMRAVPGVEPAPGFRMADFSRWGRAASLHLGHRPEEFDAAYRQAVDRQAGELIDKSPLAQAMVRFAEERRAWSGSAAALLQELTALAKLFGILGSGSQWPGAANVLSEQLVTLAPVLKQAGVEVVKHPRTKHVRSRWTVRLVTPSAPGDATLPRTGHEPSPDNSFNGNDLRRDDAGDGPSPPHWTRNDLIRSTQAYLNREAQS